LVQGCAVGGVDGDGTAAEGGACPPPFPGQTPIDQPGIAPGENYRFLIDTNCNRVPDYIITVQGGAGPKTPNVIVPDGGGNPIGGITASAQYGTSDLEIHITGLALSAIFEVSTFV